MAISPRAGSTWRRPGAALEATGRCRARHRCGLAHLGPYGRRHAGPVPGAIGWRACHSWRQRSPLGAEVMTPQRLATTLIVLGLALWIDGERDGRRRMDETLALGRSLAILRSSPTRLAGWAGNRATRATSRRRAHYWRRAWPSAATWAIPGASPTRCDGWWRRPWIGDRASARPLLEESLGIRHVLGDKWGLADSLLGLGGLAYGVGVRRSARLLAQCVALRREMGERKTACGR
jgi:hypothetical protein